MAGPHRRDLRAHVGGLHRGVQSARGRSWSASRARALSGHRPERRARRPGRSSRSSARARSSTIRSRGRSLGRYEEVLGYAQVRTRVSPRSAEAVFVPIEGKPAPQPDDGVRITRGRIKVGDHARARPDQSPTAPDLPPGSVPPGDRARALEALPGDRSPDGLGPLRPRRRSRQEILALPERAVRIVEAARTCAGWIVPVLIERRGVVYLDVTWISAVTGTALFSRRRALLPPDRRGGAAIPVGAGQRRLMSCWGFLLWYGRA